VGGLGDSRDCLTVRDPRRLPSGDGSSSLVWFFAPGFRVLGIDDIACEVVVEVETESARAACPGCGVLGRAKKRRWMTLRDAPLADRPIKTGWRKRVMECRQALCETWTWTE